MPLKIPKIKVPKLPFGRKSKQDLRTGGRFSQVSAVPRPRQDFGSRHRAERQKMKREALLSDVRAQLKSKLKIIAVVLVGLALLVAGGIGLTFLHSQETFILKDIVISGNNKISTLEIVSELQDLKGRSLFSFSAAGIEDQLKHKFTYAKDVDVRKVLPGTIEVEFVERFPVQARVTQSGSYLVDEDRVVVEVLFENPVPELSSEDRLILNGYGNPESKFIQERYANKIEDLPTDQQIKWEVLSEQRKRNELEEYRNELQSAVDGRINTNKQALVGVNLQLPIVEDYATTTYKLGARVEAGKFNVSNFVYQNMSAKNYVLQRIIWRTNFALYVNIEGGPQLIFSVTKDPGRQILEFETVKARVDLRGVSVIDLRSNRIAVK